MGLPGGSFFWDLGSFFKVFCIRLQKCFGFLVTLWLLGTGPETNLYVVIFCLFHGSAFALNFTISFLGPPGPISGPCLIIFQSFLYQNCRSAMFGLPCNFVAYGDGRATRETLLSEAVLRFSGPSIGSVRASSFVDNFVCCGKRGAHRLLLEPT